MMKPMTYSAAVAMLILSSCSSAYKTAQTPDDVYYSPSKPVYASNTQRQASSQAVDQDSERYVTYDDNGRSTDTYVTYEDEDEEKYDYARRLDRFNRPYSGSYWDNYYYDDFYFGGPSLYSGMYSPYFGRAGWGMSMGLGWGGGFNNWYSPYSAWGWGSPYNHFYYGMPAYSYWGGGYGGWYGGGSPWFGSPWYGGFYPGGVHGGGGSYRPRPANAWSPRGSTSSPVYGNSRGRLSNGSGSGNYNGAAPVRTFDRTRTGGNTGGRVAAPNTGDRGNAGVPRRTFDRSGSERPVTAPSRPANNQPTRSFDRSSSNNNSQPSYNPPPSRSSSPSYTPSNSGSNSGSNSAPVRSGRRG
ncbi:hypothetical protein MKQ68_13525 [Chitinophaga horti]|uniref:Vitellogenin II n=1 Tax=Chitinophaga horti TaxID=2920382 RepID=A0ABY6IUR4_9BACT|nr:hypothetical protein [Chitinophaga horti]UYQ91114.1 hypothetical protein MKQ68_13525 [Chitinophaga horti]